MGKLLKNGLAVGEIAARSLTDTILEGVEHLNGGDGDPNEASFADIEDIASTSGMGVYIDGRNRLMEIETSLKNLAVFGPTGSGKTTMIAAPNLLDPNGHSYIVHDPSGQLAQWSGEYLKERGYEVMVLDFNSTESACFNPMDFVKDSSDANKLAMNLTNPTIGSQQGDKFWEQSTKSLLRLLIMPLTRMEPKYRNIANLKHLLTGFAAGETAAIDSIFSKHSTNEEFLEYKALIKSNEKTLSSIVMSALAALELWNDELVCKLTSMTSIHFQQARRGNWALFIRNSVWDSKYYKPIISIVLESAMKTYMKELPCEDDKPVFFIIDECSTLHLDSLDQVLSNNRKHRFGLLLFFQSRSQVYNAFGQEAGSNLLANCHSKIYLTGGDMKTAKELEDLLGKKTSTRDGRRVSLPLLSSQNIRMMNADEAILISGSQKPFLLKMTPFYAQPFLRHRAGKEPFLYKPTIIPSPVSLIPLK